MTISKKLSNAFLNFIKNNTSTSEEDLEKISYGIQVVVLTASKSILLFIIAYLLGILEYVLISCVALAFARNFASGIHLSSTLQCIIITFFLHFGNVYLSLNFSTNILLRSIIFIISFILILLYAPADTEYRPLVSKKLRRDLKIKSVVVIMISYISMLFIENNVYANIITFSFLGGSLLITPLVYKLFGRKYNNYKNI